MPLKKNYILLVLVIQIFSVSFSAQICSSNRQPEPQANFGSAIPALPEKIVSPYMTVDDILGLKCIPGAVGHVLKRYGSKVIYDVVYTIDKYGRRVVETTGQNKQKYALFFGCSCTFGVGLNDNETLPYYFELGSKDMKAYNYSLGGYGPNHLLALLETHSFSKEIPESKGAAFYIFIDDHVNRAIGNSTWMTMPMSAGKDWSSSPYYRIEHGVPVYKGSFLAGRKFITGLYLFLAKTELLKKLHIYNFPGIRKKHYDYTAKLIKGMSMVYKRKFNNDNFYVVILPFYSASDSLIIPCLKKYNIKYIDLTSRQADRDEYLIPADGHPNARLNRLVAKELIEYIDRRGL